MKRQSWHHIEAIKLTCSAKKRRDLNTFIYRTPLVAVSDKGLKAISLEKSLDLTIEQCIGIFKIESAAVSNSIAVVCKRNANYYTLVIRAE